MTLELPANTDYISSSNPQIMKKKPIIIEEEKEEDDDEQIRPEDLLKPDKPKIQRREVVAKPKVVSRPLARTEIQMTSK